VLAVKLGLTSLDILAVVKELESALISARIENIYQLEGGAFMIRLHTRSGQENIIVDSGRRLNLTRYKQQVPEKPTPEAAQLRHFLLPSKVNSIGQLDFDRIIYMELLKGDQVVKVYFELFGDGNIVVVDGEGTVRYALHYKEMRDRVIKYGLPYSSPPPRGRDLCSQVALEEIASQKVSLVRSLTRIYNLPPELVEEALHRIPLSPNQPSDQIRQDSLNAFLKSAGLMLDQVREGKLAPNIGVSDGRPTTVLPLEFGSMALEQKHFETFNEAVDEYFSSLSSDTVAAKRRSPAEEALKSYEGILLRQRSHIEELERVRKECNETGIILMSNLHAIQSAIDQVIKARRSGADWSSIKSSGIPIKAINQAKGTMTLSVSGKELEIDFKIPASKNAEKLFSDSKEAGKKLEGLGEAIKETEDKIEKARKGLMTVTAPVSLKAMKKEWFERFRWTISSQGFLLLGGKDSTQNEVLVKKHMDPSDLFVHSDVPGGSVVVIKSEGKAVPEETKSEAVAFAVSYSRAWKAGLRAADGYWVPSNQVTKSPPTGEYLGKGAFMIYGERNYIHGSPLGFNLCAKIEDSAFKVIVSFTELAGCVKVTPGELTGPALIKRIKELLVQRADESNSRLIMAIPASEIEACLPQGGCSVN
jgi:predicted ribosome quality control (RQC) complex YloA/Tae2 family protein